MPTDHAHLRELFIAACDLPSHEQDVLIDERCGEDDDLRAALRRLLNKDGSEDGILADDDLASGIRIDTDLSSEPRAPSAIGQYAVKRLLGEGGMGTVWLAEQASPKRDVAVKVVRSGVMNQELRRRFELEAAVLGRLQHPGIAQVYEAGMYDDGSGGRPFFAMEYVDGQPLGKFVNARGLPVRERLAMFVEVCEAVQHAHQRGVVHRDLKPGNILVTDDARPKIMDFGVARATDSDLQVTTLKTDVGQLIGTLPYMSPEQVTGDAHGVDTRSDVYSLGVMLYQLLADRLPYDLADRSIVTAARVISEDEPSPLTTANRAYRGDLNTIVLKALEKDPDRRYQSASDLAADIRRYLNDEPIVARPATALYQLRKFARRNKGLVGGIVVAFIVLIAGVVVATALAIGQTRALHESERQADRAQTMNTFLADVLAAADSVRSGDVRLVDLLRDASARVDTEFADHPDLAIQVHEMLARAFANVSFVDEQLHHASRAIELIESERGEGHPSARVPRFILAEALLNQGRMSEAESVARLLAEDDTAPVDVTSFKACGIVGFAMMRQGRIDEAEAWLRAGLARAESALDWPNAGTIRIKFVLARVLDTAAAVEKEDEDLVRRRRDEAARLFERVIRGEDQLNLQSYSGIHARTALINRAIDDQRYDEAIQLATTAVEIIEERLGETHPQLAEPTMKIAMASYYAGRARDAAPYVIRAVTLQQEARGYAVLTLVFMADGLRILDAAEEWEKGLEYAQVLEDRMGGGGHGGEFGIFLAYFQTRLDNFDAATPILNELLANEPDLSDARRAQLNYTRGVWCTKRGDTEQARRHFERALETCSDHPHAWPRREAVQAALAALSTQRP